MKLLILVLLWLSLQAQSLRDYTQLLSLWQKAVAKEAIFSLKQFASQQEMCNDAPCEPFYFLAENTQLISQQQTNLTVLVLSGLRGDDTISPSILLNAYGHLNAARTIFFPLANPSGINKNIPLTVPGSINPEKDFPLGDSQKCFQSAAAKSLLYLYRTYSIDLTIYVHDGKPSIVYSWGTKHQDTFQSQDYGIYADIADMVRFEGNDDKEMDTIEAGSMYELQPAVTVANFVDWAYGASKYPEILSKCGEKIEGAAAAKFNGLVLALGVGKIATGQNSISRSEKQLSRALLLLQKIASITAPNVQVAISSRDITVTLNGCKTGTASIIKLTKETGQTLFQRSGDAILKGDITNGPAEPKTFLHKLTAIPTALNYQITFQCDNGWLNVGKTAFSKFRVFTQKGSFASTQPPPFPSPSPQPLPLSQEKAQSEEGAGWRTYEIIGGVLVLLIAVWMIVGIRLGLKVQQQQRIKNFNQKFETVEIVEDIEAYSNSIDEKEMGETETGETKEQDHDNQRLTAT